MIWRAWYNGRRRFVSTEVPFAKLPESGLIFGVEYRDATHRVMWSGGDWYWTEDGLWHYVPSGDWDTWQPKPSISCASCIKQGVGVSDLEFKAIEAEAWVAPWP